MTMTIGTTTMTIPGMNGITQEIEDHIEESIMIDLDIIGRI